jgi:hypothetical protein
MKNKLLGAVVVVIALAFTAYFIHYTTKCAAQGGVAVRGAWFDIVC